MRITRRISAKRTITTHEDGMVSVEAAVVLPALLLVLALALGVITTVGAQLQLVDAARESARLAARGEGISAVKEAGRRSGPAGTTVEVTRKGPLLEVTARARTKPLGLLPAIRLSARAVTESEQP